VAFDEVLDAHPSLRQYEHLLRVYFDGIDEDEPPSTVARIGSPPPGAEPHQQTLLAAAAGD
jgi:hypothetical protein